MNVNEKLEVLCDFDGTITNDDIGFQIIKTFAGEGWQEIEDAYQRGEKGSRQALEEIFTLTNVTEAELAHFVDSHFHVDPEFPAFVEYCKKHTIPITVLSDGFDFYIDRMFAKFQIEVPYFANKLRVVDCSLQADFPFHNNACGACGNCKLNYAERVKQKGHQILYIGDGHSDKCVSSIADILFAKGYLAQHCQKQAIPYYPFETFADILETIHGGLIK